MITTALAMACISFITLCYSDVKLWQVSAVGSVFFILQAVIFLLSDILDALAT